ncbi:hypothetical protein TSH58p_22755 (plasmid) [Azospirillum sp. TSH58]|uniref:hypothetical protein n=1 Tax=Azospirillum sp. TSH58 TaxID=664962 RepID=UPI000D5FEFD5|nr:hypothetical protein [Azospirillum sp. TSH58]AWJ86338.1 hypothetical protein TSH58p_22755 [Azospirillum sp. TSH58]PWC73415.1 hypothetical protein TSH58_04360 [Azospirillum sp. TSH58]
MTVLDNNKLGKVLALAGSDQDGEALAALRKARDMLKAAGMTFGDLTVKGVDAPCSVAPTGPVFTNPFAGFEDRMEAREPGWKAKQAAARAEQIRKEAAEREAVLAKYGSEQKAKLPNERERLLNKAVSHLWRKIGKDYANGTFSVDSLDGWTGSYGDKMPDTVRAAVETAYLMPVTLREAQDEYRFWRERDRELERVWCAPGEVGGDTYLDLPALAREQIINDMLRKGPIATLDDLLVRIEMAVELDGFAEDAAPSILEAFKRLVPNIPAPAALNGRFSLADIEADAVGVIKSVAVAHPDLCWTGFGPDPHAVKREGNAEIVFNKARADMTAPWQVGQFVRAAQFLDQAPRRKSVHPGRTSYGWKHAAERWHRHQIAARTGVPANRVMDDVYVSDGMLIAAALALGFVVERIGGTIDARISLSEHAARGF